MTRKIFRAIFFTALFVLFATLVFLGFAVNQYITEGAQRRLYQDLKAAAQSTERFGLDYLSTQKDAPLRLTLIAPDGTVLADTHADPKTMDNHLDRPEVLGALTRGFGSRERYSSTLTTLSSYKALRLSDGRVLRAASVQHTAAILLRGLLGPLIGAVLLVGLGALFWARQLTRRILRPINTLDLRHPEQAQCYEELTPLLRRLSKLTSRLHEKAAQLDGQRAEFDQITANLREGLALFQKDGTLVAMNGAATAHFGLDQPPLGKNRRIFLRDQEASKALEQALQGHACQITRPIGDQVWTYHFSPIAHGGAALYLLEVTEQHRREELRREFTANVSHELKTPLQTVLGAAELLEQGVVRPEDVTHFGADIRAQAKRLLYLIDDILKLSRLDEGHSLPFTSLSPEDLCKSAISRVAPFAQAQQVTLELTGQSPNLWGNENLLVDALVNLIDNGVKYNRPGGHVTCVLSERDGGALITVVDDGIGFGPGDIPRAFERFYRGDKSRGAGPSGTGLGLAIVKQICALHGVEPTITSSEQGSSVTLRFPAHKKDEA